MSANWTPWTAYLGGNFAAAPGSPVTAVYYPPRGVALFVANSDGEVYANSGTPANPIGWLGWRSVAQGSTTPGAVISAVPWGEQFAVFAADRSGGVYSIGGDPHRGWGDWGSVAQGSTTPGAPVTVVPWADQFALFVADPGGGIYAIGGDPQRGWGDWGTVAQGSTTPGAPVTAVLHPITGVPFTLFITDPNGGIYMASGDPQGGWGDGWSYVNPASGPEFRAAPGSPVTATTLGGAEYFAVLATGIDGLLYWTEKQRHQRSWTQWSPITDITALPGTPITQAIPDDLFSLFVTDVSGKVLTKVGAFPQNWDWVQRGTTAPGSRLTTYFEGGSVISLFVTGTDGQVYFTRATSL